MDTSWDVDSPIWLLLLLLLASASGNGAVLNDCLDLATAGTFAFGGGGTVIVAGSRIGGGGGTRRAYRG